MTKYVGDTRTSGLAALSSTLSVKGSGDSSMARTSSTCWLKMWSLSSSSPFLATPGEWRVDNDIIELFGDYDDYMSVRSADNLRVHRDPVSSVVVLEYEVHGEAVQTGRPYDNRFVSIVTVRGGKVRWWRDYLDPVAVFDAAGWPDHG